ncbi:TniQ family protein [Paracoccus sp. FO-3]|uniref:TniQ family protein n=2 Tax=Paracoccus TaxID=265 RepID=UPI0015E38D41|nr:TniQ family protein [Paracoccus sp. FO-3]
MARLFPRLPFVPDETPLSWAARLAAFHTGGRLVPFLNDLGIALVDLVAGATEAITRLCDIADQDPDPVLHNTIHALGERQFLLRDESFAAEMTTGPETRFCPACLAEDEAGGYRPDALRRGRLIWRLQPVRVCPVHHLTLISRRLNRWDDIAHELSVLVPEGQRALLALAETAPVQQPSPLQGYVLARLEGQSGPAWADGQGIEQVTRATEMLGGVLEFGTQAKPAELSMADWNRASNNAWSYVRQGEDGVRSGLGMLQQRAVERGMVGHRNRFATFGMLYRWLSSPKLTKDPGPIRELLRQHIIDTTDILPQEKLLGEIVTMPKWGSISSIAKSGGVHPLTLRDVLIARRVIPAKAKDQPCSATLVDFQIGHEVALEMRRAVAVTALPGLLNASRPMVTCLINTGLLAALHGGNGQKQGKVSRSIDGLRVEALINKINQIFPKVESAPAGHVKLAKAAEMSRLPMEVILIGVFGHHLERVLRLQREPGLGGLLVDPQEVKALPARIPDKDMPFVL